jgi:hypothetical protein
MHFCGMQTLPGKRQRRTFVFVMAGFNCLWVPYGTLLWAVTFLALATEDAKRESPQ